MAALSPLHTPATLEVAMILIQAGANLNAHDALGDTALHKAASGSSAELVQLLVDKGCFLDCVNMRGLTPIFMAVVRGQTNIIQRLVEAGADGNLDRTVSPLILAIRRRDKDMVKLLLQSVNCNPNQANIHHGPMGQVSLIATHGMSPLHLAVCIGEVEIVEMLLDKGASMDCQDSDTNTPLMGAAFNNYIEVTRLLLSRGCNVNKANNHGYTAMHHACWEGHLDLVKLLMDHGAIHDAQTQDKNTPLALACHGNHADVVGYLTQWPCHVNNSDKDLDTPLHYTTYNGNEESTLRLLSLGANPDVENNVSTTPLWNAVLMQNRSIVWHLLKANVRPSVASIGIDQHAQSEGVTYIYDEPYTPLYVACDVNDLDTAKLLVLSGLDVTKENWIWYSTRHPAFLEEHPEFCHWLVSNMATAQSLRQICRTYLRRLFGRTLSAACVQLEIPVNLKDYLMLKYL